MKERILLHACCAPCSTAVLRELRSTGFNVSGLFYNPNVHPEDEFRKRLEAFRKYSAREKLNAIVDDYYDIDLFNAHVAGKEGDRCLNCYRLRLERTAHCAKENKFDMFTTTILISPYQKHDLVKQAGDEMAKKYDIEFYYEDFRPFYKGTISLSKEMGLYRQKYCGCYLSIEDLPAPKNSSTGPAACLSADRARQGQMNAKNSHRG